MGGGGSSEMRQLQERVEGMERRMGMLERLVGALQGIVNGHSVATSAPSGDVALVWAKEKDAARTARRAAAAGGSVGPASAPPSVPPGRGEGSRKRGR